MITMRELLEAAQEELNEATPSYVPSRIMTRLAELNKEKMIVDRLTADLDKKLDLDVCDAMADKDCRV
jgi:hypothetical protein